MLITVYNCRSSAEWKDDMALSVTHSPNSKSTKAVLYGCTEEIRDMMIHRLERCNHVVHHPLAIPTLFCDMERNRQFDIVNPIVTKLVNKALNVAKPQNRAGLFSNSTRNNITATPQTTGFREDSEDLMNLWLQVSDLKRGLETWKRQLENLISHCQGLVLVPSGDIEERQYNDAGRRIQQRLVELKCEYEEKIRQCADVIDGMVLAAHLVRGPQQSRLPSSFS